MKALYLITSLLVFSSSSQAQIIINKIDFSKAESIAKIIKGVNTIRGTQSVVLQLDKSQNIKFVDASNYDHLDPVSIYINSKGDVYINKNEEIKDREHFLKTLKEFSALSKSLNIKTFPIMLTFHDNISGSPRTPASTVNSKKNASLKKLKNEASVSVFKQQTHTAKQCVIK